MPGGVIGLTGQEAASQQVAVKAGQGGLTQSDLYTLALDAGLSPGAARTAAAIGMAESGGNPNAHNTTPPDNSYGIWQINLYGSLASRVREFGLTSPTDLFIPMTNAKAMARISSRGTNFKPWSTYNDGSYQKFIANPVSKTTSNPGWLSAVGNVVTAPFQAVEGTAQAAADAIKVLGRTAEWMSNPHNWIRVGFVIGGGVVLVAGIVAVLESTKTGQAVNDAAGQATRAATNVGTAVATDGASLAAKSAAKGAGSGTANRIRDRKVTAHKTATAAAAKAAKTEKSKGAQE